MLAYVYVVSLWLHWLSLFALTVLPSVRSTGNLPSSSWILFSFSFTTFKAVRILPNQHPKDFSSTWSRFMSSTSLLQSKRKALGLLVQAFHKFAKRIQPPVPRGRTRRAERASRYLVVAMEDSGQKKGINIYTLGACSW